MKNLTKLLLAASLVATLSTSVFAFPPPNAPDISAAIINATNNTINATTTHTGFLTDIKAPSTIGSNIQVEFSAIYSYSESGKMIINLKNSNSACQIAVRTDGNSISISNKNAKSFKCTYNGDREVIVQSTANWKAHH